MENWLQLPTIPADSGGAHGVGLQQFPHPVRTWKACWLSVSISYLFSAAWEKPMSISHVCFFIFFLIFQCRTCRLSFHARKGKWKDGNSQTVHYSRFLDTSWPLRLRGLVRLLENIKEQSLASVNYSVWFNRAHSSFFFFILLYLRRLVFTLCTWLWLWLTAVFHYCSTSPRALVSVTSGWSQLLRALPGSADLFFLSLNM